MQNRIVKSIISGLLLATLISTANAESTATTLSTKSFSYSKADAPQKATRDELLKQSKLEVLQPLQKQGYRKESSSVESVDYSSHPDFSIYNAHVDLISDFDYDGFYHRFSVEIDADTLYSVGYVYARLYLSYEGGPWNHYATSDAYHIYSDSELDSFVIETELAEGFPAGHYDIRIELFDADHNTWLLTYGPYEDTSLSALPLEDSIYDDIDPVVSYPVEAEVVVAATGSMHAWLLLLAPLMMATRRYSASRKQ